MEGALREVVELIVKGFDTVAVILFGSRARGDWGPWSDYDILIIARFCEPYLERIGRVLEQLKDVRLPVEPHPYTLEEALEMLRRGNPLIVDALEEGKVLYSTGEFEVLIEEFRKMKERGLRRSTTTIVLPEGE